MPGETTRVIRYQKHMLKGYKYTQSRTVGMCTLNSIYQVARVSYSLCVKDALRQFKSKGVLRWPISMQISLYHPIHFFFSRDKKCLNCPLFTPVDIFNRICLLFYFFGAEYELSIRNRMLFLQASTNQSIECLIK